eukprot:gene492-922_t
MKIFENLRKSTLLQINRIAEGEFHPFTNNHFLFKSINKARNKPLRDTIDALMPTNEGLVSLDAFKAIIDRNESMSCDEHILREMEITLDAYGKVAAKCAIDMFPKQIDTNLLDPFQNAIQESLQRTDTELKVLLAENQRIARRRKEDAMKATVSAFESFLSIKRVDKLAVLLRLQKNYLPASTFKRTLLVFHKRSPTSSKSFG